MGYNSFEEMPVWQKAMDLAVRIFKLTEKLPRKEDYGLTSQIRRSTLSISGNLAEGFGRKHMKDKLNFYYNSRASLTETRNYLIYGYRVEYFPKTEFEGSSNLVEEIWKELNSLINSLEKKTQPQP
ncbi:MAG: four helix bundle protein [Candidatus Jettenia sp.]|nr:MAG: four helix bundle protein [Candidatus Jettenia sp.]